MEVNYLKDAIVQCLNEKGATDVHVIDITTKSSIGDYFIIATGRNLAQVRALSDFIEESLEKDGCKVMRKEGYQDGRWIVLDYGDIIVHIFNSETREFYCLEQIWETK